MANQEPYFWRGFAKDLIVALIGFIVWFAQDKLQSQKNPAPSVSVKQNTIDSNHDVFQNTGTGQQNNNTGSGTQNVNNK